MATKKASKAVSNRPALTGSTAPQGEAHGRSKLTEELVTACRDLHRRGVPLADLALTFDISPSVLSRAVTGLTWSHLPGSIDDGIKRPRKKKK